MELIYGRISEFSEEEFSVAFNWLSDERKNAVMRMRFENDRKRSVLGELLARREISKRTGLAEKDVIINRTENGKPYCENAEIHFSISHCKDLVVCAVHRFPVGVDIEFIRPLDLRITKFACTEKDLILINELETDSEKEIMFFKLWTAKEAFIKFHGKVLADLKTVDYEAISKNCTFFELDNYIAAIYTEK